MGWRDINMNRRKPPLRLAVVPMADGEDFATAVMRKAARDAVDCVAEQIGQSATVLARDQADFVSGHVLGWTCFTAQKHGVDCESLGGFGLMTLATDAIAPVMPLALGSLRGISFVPCEPGRSRSRPETADGRSIAHAGYLAGHLEALCGTRKLLRQALSMAVTPSGGEAYLTLCDITADPLQTRAPTASIRFDAAERAVILAAFREMSS